MAPTPVPCDPPEAPSPEPVAAVIAPAEAAHPLFQAKPGREN
jgi:hypothetical protein